MIHDEGTVIIPELEAAAKKTRSNQYSPEADAILIKYGPMTKTTGLRWVDIAAYMNTRFGEIRTPEAYRGRLGRIDQLEALREED